MKKFGLNSVLVIMNLFSIFFILQIDIHLLPLFPTFLSNEVISSINSLVSNLSQGVLVSTFFYYLLSFIPERKKAISIRTLIKPKLQVIIDSMAINIEYFLTSCCHIKNLNEADKTIRDRLLSVSTLKETPMNFVFKTEQIHDQKVWYSTANYSELDYFIQDREKVINCISEILNMQHIINEEVGLIELLHKIKDSKFYYAINYFKENKPMQPYISTPKGRFNIFVVEYYELFNELKTYVNPTTVIVKNE